MDEFLSLIDQKETKNFLKKLNEEKKDDFYETPKSGDAKYPRVLAVTACPTGIAHTFMAAEALNKKGAERGFQSRLKLMDQQGLKIF